MSTSSDAHLPYHTPYFLVMLSLICFCFFLANGWAPRGFLTTFHPQTNDICTPLYRSDYLTGAYRHINKETSATIILVPGYPFEFLRPFLRTANIPSRVFQFTQAEI